MNTQRLIDTFYEIVQIDSPSGEEQVLTNYLKNILLTEQLVDKLSIDQYGNLHAVKKGSCEGIVLMAHTDTVEPGRGIEPIQKNGYIVSSGQTILGADNKAAIAAIIEALRSIKEQHISTPTLDFLFTPREEISNPGASTFDIRKLNSQIVLCFDSANKVGTIVTSQPYYVRIDLEIIGKSAHASKPEDGVNALSVVGRILSKIDLGRLDSETTLNFGLIKGGDARNTIPEKITFGGELRSSNKNKVTKYQTQLAKDIKKIATYFNATIKLDFFLENPGYNHLDDEQGVQFINQLEELIKNNNLEPIQVMTGGVSDANYLNDKGLICVNLGYGAEFAHTTRERIKISELKKLTDLIYHLALNLKNY